MSFIYWLHNKNLKNLKNLNWAFEIFKNPILQPCFEVTTLWRYTNLLLMFRRGQGSLRPTWPRRRFFLPARRYAARYDSVCLSQMKVLSKRLNGSNSFMARRLQYPRVIVHCFWLEFRYLQNNGTSLWKFGPKSGLQKFSNSMWIVGSSHRMWCVMVLHVVLHLVHPLFQGFLLINTLPGPSASEAGLEKT